MPDDKKLTEILPITTTIAPTDLMYKVKINGVTSTSQAFEVTTIDDRYVFEIGDTMTGLLQWSGTGHAGLQVNSLTTSQRDALTPANGMLIFNTTDTQFQGYDGSWDQIGLTLPVIDTQTIIKGSVDATKLMRFEIDGFTTGSTRVLTPPDQDFTIVGLEVANIFTVGQTVDGSADEIQLTVQANGIQTTNLQENQDSSGNVLSGIDERGIPFADGNTVSTNYFAGGNVGNISATGGENIGIGYQVLEKLTSGIRNVALGFDSLKNNTTGRQNFALGRAALEENISGENNIAIGFEALRNITTTNQLVAIGAQALRNATGGVQNTAVGFQSLLNASPGTRNTAVGALALNNNTGSRNIGIGNSASTGSGTRNVVIGSGANADSKDESIILGAEAKATKFNQMVVGSTARPINEITNVSETALTDTVNDILVLTHNSSGTPATSFGIGVLFQGESSTTVDQDMSRLSALWATATHVTRKARGIWSVFDTAEREAIRIEANGSEAMLGVLGANAIVKQAHIVDADGALADITTKFNTLLSYLENFGFVATS